MRESKTAMDRLRTVASESSSCKTVGVNVLFIELEFSDRMLGGSRSLSLIIKHLRRTQPHVLCFRDGEFYEMLKSSGIPTTLMGDVRDNPFDYIRDRPWRNRLRLLARLLATNLRVYRFIRGGCFGVVHCNSIYDFLFSFLGVKLAGGRVVFNIRATHPKDRMKWHWQIALLASSAIVVLSEEMKQYYVDRIWRLCRQHAAKKIQSIYSGIPFDELQEYYKISREQYRQALCLPESACVIAYVGSIIPRKMQLEFLERVVSPLSCQAPNLLFCFVGDVIKSDPQSVQYRDKCLRAVEQLGLKPYVRFVGHQAVVYPWFIASDFSALASTFEGLPRVVVESLACSRPVVSTKVTSAQEILEKYQCGFVVAHGDWKGMAERSLQLCQDTELRAQMTLRAGEVARRLFDLDSVVSRYEEIYLKLAGGIS